MTASIEAEKQAILAKEGVHLFKEFRRVYAVALVEDYYSNIPGKWKNDELRVDLQIIWQHRGEAGAPDPPPLSQVEDPVIPDRPAGTSAMDLLLQNPPRLLTPPKLVAPGGQIGIPMDELREIAVFVGKAKLDPSRTKAILAKLHVGRRKYVMGNFVAGVETGEAGIAELEAYILECEAKDEWPAAVDTAVVAPPMIPFITKPTIPIPRPLGLGGLVVGPARVGMAVSPPKAGFSVVQPRQPMGSAVPVRPPAGVKRPLPPTVVPMHPSKRPVPSSAFNPAVVAAVRPAGLLGVRPTGRPVAPPGGGIKIVAPAGK